MSARSWAKAAPPSTIPSVSDRALYSRIYEIEFRKTRRGDDFWYLVEEDGLDGVDGSSGGGDGKGSGGDSEHSRIELLFSRVFVGLFICFGSRW